jgi:hypothetical protein
MADQPATDAAARELEDAGLAGYETDAATAAAGAAEGAAPPPRDALEPYTAEELAQLTAGLSALGIPAGNLDAYQRAVLARTRPAFEMLGMGEALAAYGVGHGSGIDAMPAWVRLLAGVGVVGFLVVGARREFGRDPNEPDAAPEGAA